MTETAVEAMAKALHDYAETLPPGSEFRAFLRSHKIGAAIAALAALEALHLPDHALAMGFDAGGGRCGAVREEFKAIIRALKDGG